MLRYMISSYYTLPTAAEFLRRRKKKLKYFDNLVPRCRSYARVFQIVLDNLFPRRFCCGLPYDTHKSPNEDVTQIS